MVNLGLSVGGGKNSWIVLNKNLLFKVAVRCIEAGIQGAKHNVEINLEGITDNIFKTQQLELANKQVKIAMENRDKVLEILANRN